jgi:peptide methionine sulfoxide reductase MsrB
MPSNYPVYASQISQAIKNFKQDGLEVYRIEGSTLTYENHDGEVFNAEPEMGEHGLVWKMGLRLEAKSA